MKPLVQVQELSLQFDAAKAAVLSNISFELFENERVLLLGPSGCGKSTLTFCLNGIYPRELDGSMTGQVIFNGKNTADYLPGELSKQVGVVFQDPETQFCMLTVEDEIAFGLENHAVPPSEMEDKIVEVLQLVDLLAFKSAPIATLSGGQKQRLALACILALEPQLLILDEPTANLDPEAAQQLIRTIQTLQRKRSFGLLIIEHQLDGWTDIADRCLLLQSNGELFYDGSFKEAIASKLASLETEGIWLPKVAQYVLPAIAPPYQHVPLTIGAYAEQPIELPDYTLHKQTETQPILQEPFMKLNNLSWHVKDRNIIQDVSFQLYTNEFVAIVGANGSGKTSLSRLLAGIQSPTKGDIVLQGKKLPEWRQSDLRKKIGYVFQNPEHQFIAHTVFEELAFGLRLRGLSEDIIIEKVSQALASCHLSGMEQEHPYTLSQGQKRRLSVATMIIDEQEMLLLDEPTFGQDARTNQELMQLLTARFQQGTSIVMITHDMELVYHYATRVIVMEHGHKVADMPTAALWNHSDEQLSAWKLKRPIPLQLQQLWERKCTHVFAAP